MRWCGCAKRQDCPTPHLFEPWSPRLSQEASQTHSCYSESAGLHNFAPGPGGSRRGVFGRCRTFSGLRRPPEFTARTSGDLRGPPRIRNRGGSKTFLAGSPSFSCTCSSPPTLRALTCIIRGRVHGTRNSFARCPQDGHESPQRGLRGSQEAKRAPRAPKSAQERLNSAPRHPQAGYF